MTKSFTTAYTLLKRSAACVLIADKFYYQPGETIHLKGFCSARDPVTADPLPMPFTNGSILLSFEYLGLPTFYNVTLDNRVLSSFLQGLLEYNSNFSGTFSRSIFVPLDTNLNHISITFAGGMRSSCSR
jgi:hypothetical protein